MGQQGPRAIGRAAALLGQATSFDYSFIQSYFRQFNLHLPFHYRYAATEQLHRRHATEPDHPEINVPFSGDVHNALHDVLHQIKTVFVASEQQKEAA
ncbi:3'-5' exoribonuclease [Mesorhizobium sp. C386A]|uniref:3'-5' exoribonuclease domain-containing protein n=1 Tax=Mesorhizobium sp. C386A TaxID=2956831 RepID=UPI003334E4AA